MYGWRGRIGVIKPGNRGKSFAFWYDHVPSGIEIVPAYIGFRNRSKEEFLSGIDRADHLVRELAAADCDVISVSGAPPFLLKGLQFERAWGDRLSQELGVPVLTPMEPHALAMQALGIRRVGIGTTFGSELREAMVDYLTEFGIQCSYFEMRAPGEPRPSLGPDQLVETLDELGFEEVYRYCKRGLIGLGPDADGLYVNGGAWDVGEAIDPLEEDLGTNVVFGQAAEVWFAFKKLRVNHRILNRGALLRENPGIPVRG